MKIVAIIQARMGSTRLPGKVLMDIAGEPMLARVIERTRRARRLHEVVVATSTLVADDAIEALCRARGWACFRGDEADVLDRYWRAAQKHEADIVVRITSDCPLIDPGLVDDVVNTLLATPGAVYCSNTQEPRSFPRGLDCEAFTIEALQTAWSEGRDQVFREHVTTFLWQQPARFRLARVRCPVDHSSERWTVDTPEDLALVRALFAQDAAAEWSWTQVLEYIDKHPELRSLNNGIRQKHL